MLSLDHLFPLQEILDLLYQRGKIMEPEGGQWPYQRVALIQWEECLRYTAVS